MRENPSMRTAKWPIRQKLLPHMAPKKEGETMAADKELDRLDRDILRLIAADASLSLADIAAKVGLTPTPCWKRIRRMEQAAGMEAIPSLIN